MLLEEIRNFLPDWSELLILILLALMAGRILAFIALKVIGLVARKRNNTFWKSFRRHISQPIYWIFPIIVTLITLYSLPIELPFLSRAKLLFEIGLYICGGWGLIRMINVVEDLVRNQFRINQPDNLEERKIITQFQYIKKIISLIVFFITGSFILLQFDTVRELGRGLLTSAGVAGIIIGLAAQKSIANLLAGFQLAFTQPIRIDDVVIVEGEWGRIEEITLTYVVVKIWDERRLVVPLNYFNEQPFQNWTRRSSQLLAYVYLYMDYRVPMRAMRKKLEALLENNELWDGRVNKIQMTDSKKDQIEVRILMSASDASKAWDLRCEVRESMVAFLQEEYPESLPRTRVEFAGGEQKPLFGQGAEKE
jgi:small-conductance mechanosensitive channel